ncbi:MAG: 2-amino-3,7-dideoxy-D-threo-hept-6-ulosonate synthase [Promethearchaeota archaeon]
MDGIQRRISRISRNGRFLIVPMDHGISQGPIKGIQNMNHIVEQVSIGKASAIVTHKGVLKQLSLKSIGSCGVIMHLSASTKLGPMPNYKVLVGKVEEAVALGADAVSIHINIGGEETEPVMLQSAGEVADACRIYGMPLLTMAYARGQNVSNSLDAEKIAFVVRVAYELGADIVKCNYSGDSESFKQVIEGCSVPVIIAGGPKIDNDQQLLEMVKGSLIAGAKGISIGRNIFQHANPQKIVEALGKIIYEDKSVENVLEFL